jgi:hypothetical protein
MVTRSLRWLVGLAAALAMLSCRSATDPIAEQITDLDRAESLWVAAGIHHYSYEIGSASDWYVDSLRVDVRNDFVSATTGLRDPSTLHPSGRTVPELFAAIRQSLANGSAVRASFDGQLGYPTQIVAPDPPGWADASWSANIGNFQVMAAGS